jgi:hypothetical protein
VGLSPTGLSVLPLSSVIPGPLPVLERYGSEPEGTDSAIGLAGAGVPAGEDVDCDNLALKRALFAVVMGAGADFRYIIDGGEYEFACGSTAVRGGGECRICRLLRT